MYFVLVQWTFWINFVRDWDITIYKNCWDFRIVCFCKQKLCPRIVFAILLFKDLSYECHRCVCRAGTQVKSPADGHEGGRPVGLWLYLVLPDALATCHYAVRALLLRTLSGALSRLQLLLPSLHDLSHQREFHSLLCVCGHNWVV